MHNGPVNNRIVITSPIYREYVVIGPCTSTSVENLVRFGRPLSCHIFLVAVLIWALCVVQAILFFVADAGGREQVKAKRDIHAFCALAREQVERVLICQTKLCEWADASWGTPRSVLSFSAVFPFCHSVPCWQVFFSCFLCPLDVRRTGHDVLISEHIPSP
jgi:hypothetical protein